MISNIQPIWNVFADPLDYQYQSKKDLFSLEFLSPSPNKFASPRPFTTSLFYKMADSDPYKMIMLQKLTYGICTVLFSLIFISFIEPILLKIITFYLFLFLFSWLNIVGWTNNVLSESTSTSLLFLWLGILLLFIKKNNWFITILFCIVSFFFSFTRDSWPYIILITIVIISGVNFFKNKSDKLKNIFALLFCLTLFIVQGKTSEIGQRHKMPIFNVIVGRISKNDNHLKWFEKQGMPLASEIKKDFKDVDVDSDLGRPFIYSKYLDSKYLPLMDWAGKKGKSVYQLFLLSHPSYLLLFDQTNHQTNRIFCYNFYTYFHNTSKLSDFTETTFPLWDLTTTLVLVLLLFFVAIFVKNSLYTIPLLITFLFFINSIILYNADTMEVQRHLFITQIIIQLLNIMCFSLLINVFINLIKRKPNGI
ncbi:MAG: hypothetical protein ACK50L_07580 [Bacteroidota bacterium]